MAEEKKIIDSEPLKVIKKKTVKRKPVKKPITLTTKPKSNNSKTVSKVTKPIRNYPIVTVEKSLIIAQKLKEKNGGNPWTPTDIKTAINMTDNNKFFYVFFLTGLTISFLQHKGMYSDPSSRKS